MLINEYLAVIFPSRLSVCVCVLVIEYQYQKFYNSPERWKEKQWMFMCLIEANESQ
jgi:hypothetical protein